MRASRVFRLLCVIFLAASAVAIPLRETKAAEVPVSDVTQECLDCHASSTPAMVADWKRSRHAADHDC